MSTDEDKLKRSKRFQRDQAAIKKQVKIARSKSNHGERNSTNRVPKHYYTDDGNLKRMYQDIDDE